ncbi:MULTISPECIES: Crp/Fnr family transcriptional regulator [Chryseobacterium]|uniref:cAMP-binding domain of CRP or a regulatory subunit of cAMP-dependent protein kinases n=1 Tax=Chryseobacterium salivictor TaxID=2547600 RepID=A0A4P6ZHN2_9FLAO|nr:MULTISPECIES: Crp/Fnr family transcriptional regulator [Chryseobacterium]MDQ0477698.1 CRP-like cAMP-binding protein [Chryseobacterium sp. MDT2-18]QBO58885.1 hypothetical protein NBC122_02077 [Chryseobacterium salivictor]
MESTGFRQKLSEKILSYKPDFNLEVLNSGLNQFQITDCKADEDIVKTGEVCKKIFFVEKSISRCYFLGEDGEEKTLWLEPEMSFMTDYESFTLQSASKCNIHLYEDSLVYSIDREVLFNLYMTYHEWALVGIAIMEDHFLNLFKITTTIHFNNASSNYEHVESFFTKYLDVVPLKHIASWFNISAVHLSRIRAERSKIAAN